MPTLADRIRSIAALDADQAEHLRSLCSSWQVLADLSFSDLLLYIPVPQNVDGHVEVFEVAAQLRPFTSQTLYPNDMVGTRVTQPEQPVVERAYREGRIWAQEDPVLVDGVPLQMDAVPVRYGDDVIAVVTKEGSPATSRRPGRLEEVYLQAAEQVSRMISRGWFPFVGAPQGDWPRVGDGLFVLGEDGTVSWASPNAISALRSLDVKQNVLGRRLDDCGLGETPVTNAMASRRLLDGEVGGGDTFIRMRVMPLVDDSRVCGALVLARDVTELRIKDRMLSVKDATIREIHHRVKNNLQTIASLLRLQARRMSSEEAQAALQESMLRIGSIAVVHETLAEAPSDAADFSEIVRRLTDLVVESLVAPGRYIEVKVTGSTGPLPAGVATPLAVAVTELVHNAIEHAFPHGETGTITVELDRDGTDAYVAVRDDGVGIGSGTFAGPRLGLQIVRTLIDEMGGAFKITADGGTLAELRVHTTEQ